MAAEMGLVATSGSAVGFIQLTGYSPVADVILAAATAVIAYPVFRKLVDLIVSHSHHGASAEGPGAPEFPENQFPWL